MFPSTSPTPLPVKATLPTNPVMPLNPALQLNPNLVTNPILASLGVPNLGMLGNPVMTAPPLLGHLNSYIPTPVMPPMAPMLDMGLLAQLSTMLGQPQQPVPEPKPPVNANMNSRTLSDPRRMRNM
jgi:hypothetical protein